MIDVDVYEVTCENPECDCKAYKIDCYWDDSVVLQMVIDKKLPDDVRWSFIILLVNQCILDLKQCIDEEMFDVDD